MRGRSSRILELTRRGAVARLREISYELHLLLALFPDIEDAFDEDELPVSFIVKRDARATAGGGVPRRAATAKARRAVRRRMKQAWTERRVGSGN